LKEAQKVKEIESKTNHDVKSVEYYIKDSLDICKKKVFENNSWGITLFERICPFSLYIRRY
jgi:hypothetical protein